MKRIIVLLIFSSLFLGGCQKNKPAVDVPLPGQGPVLEDLQPVVNPN